MSNYTEPIFNPIHNEANHINGQQFVPNDTPVRSLSYTSPPTDNQNDTNTLNPENLITKDLDLIKVR